MKRKPDNQVTLFETDLSDTCRLHSLFVSIEGMTSAEYENLSVKYSFAESPFGQLILASTQKGVCYMAFEDNKKKALKNLEHRFPNAVFEQKTDLLHQNALSVFQSDWSGLPEIKLHLKGTDFQLKVWKMLLKIPMGKLSTYGAIAQKIEKPNASRAVGTAIGSNPVAFLIPCHRVVQSTGAVGGYMWGSARKSALIEWEKTRTRLEI